MYRLLVIIALVVAAYSSNKLLDFSRAPVDESISHVNPPFVTLLLAVGDKYLATNLLVINTLITIGEGEQYYKDKASLHKQAVGFNPWHEDNYYQSAASLPWSGRVLEGQFVLRTARTARYKDPWPAFFEAFNEYHFNQNYPLASQLSLIAAERSEGKDKMLFKDLAAKWISGSKNYKLALTMVTELEKNTKSPVSKKRLRARIHRLEILIFLEDGVDRYKAQYGIYPNNLEELVTKKIIQSIPKDPWQRGFTLNNDGTRVVIAK